MSCCGHLQLPCKGKRPPSFQRIPRNPCTRARSRMRVRVGVLGRGPGGRGRSRIGRETAGINSVRLLRLTDRLPLHCHTVRGRMHACVYCKQPFPTKAQCDAPSVHLHSNSYSRLGRKGLYIVPIRRLFLISSRQE